MVRPIAELLKQVLPVISIDATDIANGVSFPFTRRTFDLLCSDLTKFSVARAVAASNGFPVLFSPITLNSYRPDCHGQRPPDTPSASWATDTGLSRRAQDAQIANRYLDFDRTKCVHLMDGGTADNLALRALISAFIGLNKNIGAVHRVALTTRRVLVISIDGEAATDPTLGRQRIVTGPGQVFSAVSGSQIDAYNFETLVLAQDQVKAIVENLKRDRCAQAPIIDGHACGDVRGNLVHLSLSDVSDPAARACLQAIPTGLTIPTQDVDTLVAYGENLVRDNATIHATISGLDDVAPPSAIGQ
jgi:NTE family protein